jgi:mannose-6-phosphate isomerase-like protein (cupin superfamily)
MKAIDSKSEELLMSKFERAEDLPAYEPKPQIFRYTPPDLKGRPRAITRLFTSDLMSGLLQCIHKGGETKLHSHAGMDGMWMVISGRARFHGENEVIGEFGPLEGVYIPRDVKYWFESASDEPLQLLQVEGFIKDRANRYSEFGTAAPKPETAEERSNRLQLFDARET